MKKGKIHEIENLSIIHLRPITPAENLSEVSSAEIHIGLAKTAERELNNLKFFLTEPMLNSVLENVNKRVVLQTASTSIIHSNL